MHETHDGHLNVPVRSGPASSFAFLARFARGRHAIRNEPLSEDEPQDGQVC
jgi:hypothetical protein